MPPPTVEVTINAAGTIDLYPDPLPIPPGVKGKVQWTIMNPASERWRFQQHGIEIPTGGSEFDQPHGGGTRVFTWNNNHTRAGRYPYIVRVENNSGKVERDPFMVNN